MRRIKKIMFFFVTLFTVATLTVACKTSTVEFSFETNGGEVIASVSVAQGSEYSLPVPAERDGYTFEGWYDDAGLSGDPVEKIKAESGMTFYAKWSRLYKITLDAAGGEMSGLSTVSIKAGANISEAIKNSAPTKSGLKFGGWFSGDKELSSTATATSDLTLTAKYKASYTVEFWGQNTDKSEFIKIKDNETGYAYVGQPFSTDASVTGFTETHHENARVSSDAISENAEENVFRHYYNRDEYRITFNANYPEGETAPAPKSVNVVYGDEITVPSDVSRDGYLLAGWAASRNGDILYNVNFLEARVYNKEEGDSSEITADTFVPERTVTLYAVWSKGYKNIFGGEDYIYILNRDSDAVYLSRGEYIFKGDYYSDVDEFVFRYNDRILLEGKILGDDSYAYFSAERSDMSATLYKVTEEGLTEDSSTKILFDEYNGLTYYYISENGRTVTSKGIYDIDSDGNYVVEYSEGELAGTSMVISVSTVNMGGAQITSFRIRNEEEYKLGKLMRFERNNKEFNWNNDGKFDITLTGFGVAEFNNGNTVVNYSYVLEKENNTLTLFDSMDEVFGVFKLTTVRTNNGETAGYIDYIKILDSAFVSENGEELILDGVYKAKYTGTNGTVNGEYTAKDSILGGIIVVMEYDNTNEKRTFLLKENGDDDGDADSVKTYTLENKANGYAEYYYSQNDADGKTSRLYYAPLLVLN
ncbi:MAG TPA: hypothetical protein DDW54_00050, partial [Clostridiales bacterium]|nr:hypothetical protein [Clostridiales bacterium]